ncbi:MAG: hypothetical protein JSU86_04415 [Phycisphaerales bacterium]|nr:MAG: hypothetical protein JSU86_04415 [Phycisphaerales bacterium]
MAKRAKHKAPAPLVVLDSGCALDFRFSPELRRERETVRRLAHRVVDLLADSGHHGWLADSVAGDLTCIADDIVLNSVTDLVREACAPRKAVSRG